MKHLNYRIDKQSIKDHKVVNGWFIRGQSPDSYNWECLGEFNSMESAKEFIRSNITDTNRQRVYGPEGYGIAL